MCVCVHARMCMFHFHQILMPIPTSPFEYNRQQKYHRITRNKQDDSLWLRQIHKDLILQRPTFHACWAKYAIPMGIVTHSINFTFAFWMGRPLESSLISTVEVMISAESEYYFQWESKLIVSSKHYKYTWRQNLTLLNSQSIVFQNFCYCNDCGNSCNQDRY